MKTHVVRLDTRSEKMLWNYGAKLHKKVTWQVLFEDAPNADEI